MSRNAVATCVVGYVMCFLLMKAASSLADDWGQLLVRGERFVDVGMALLGGTPWIELPWLPDACALPALVLLCACIFAESTGWAKRVCVWCLAHGLVMVMRSTTVVATIFSKSVRCAAFDDTAAVFEDAKLGTGGVEGGGGLLNVHCHDLMFSGHTSFNVLAACFINACRVRPAWRLFGWALAAGSVLSNLLVGDHYTVDILVAVYISGLVFKVFQPHFDASYVVRHHRGATDPEDANEAGAKSA